MAVREGIPHRRGLFKPALALLLAAAPPASAQPVALEAEWRGPSASRVYALAPTPDGAHALAARQDGSVELWDAREGRLLKRLAAHGDRAFSAAVSPDGRLAATGGRDQALRLWRLPGLEPVWTVRDANRSVSSLAFLPDGRLLAGRHDGSARLLDPKDGSALRGFPGHEDEVRSVAAAPDGRRLATASDDGTVRLWETETGAELRLLGGRPERVAEGGTGRDVRAVRFSADGARLLSAGVDRLLQVWDAATGEELWRLEGHADEINGLALSPDGVLALSSSNDGSVRLWDLRVGRLLEAVALAALPGASAGDRPESVAFLPAGRAFLVGTLQGRILRFALAEGWPGEADPAAEPYHRAELVSVSFSSSSDRLETAAKDGTVKSWEVASGRLLSNLNGARASGPASPAAGPVRSPDGRWRAEIDGRAVHIKEGASGKLARTIEGRYDWVSSLAFSPDGKTLAAGSDDTTVRLWEHASQRLLRVLVGHQWGVNAVAFSPDGRLLASSANDRTVRLWDAATGAPLRVLRGHESWAHGLAWSPDGRLLVSGGGEGTLRVWDPASGAPLRRLEAHRGGVHAAARQPQGTLLASGGGDGKTRLWDASTWTGRELAGVRGARSLAWSPDGKLLAAGGPGGYFLAEPEGGSVRRLEAPLSEDRGGVGHAEPVRLAEEEEDRPFPAAFFPDGARVAGAQGGRVLVWRASDGGLDWSVAAGARASSLAVSPDGRRLAAGTLDNGVLLWEFPSAKGPLTLASQGIGAAGAAPPCGAGASWEELFSASRESWQLAFDALLLRRLCAGRGWERSSAPEFVRDDLDDHACAAAVALGREARLPGRDEPGLCRNLFGLSGEGSDERAHPGGPGAAERDFKRLLAAGDEALCSALRLDGDELAFCRALARAGREGDSACAKLKGESRADCRYVAAVLAAARSKRAEDCGGVMACRAALGAEGACSEAALAAAEAEARQAWCRAKGR